MAPSRKGKEKLNEHNEKDEEVIEAAVTLLVMRRQKNFDREALIKAMNGRNVTVTELDGTMLPRLPPIENLQGIIEICSDPFVKKLTKTDLFDRQGKLSLLKNDVERALLPLLNDKEIGDLASTGIKVNTFDDEGDHYPMTFKNHFNSYKLFQGWTEFLRDRGLKENEEYYVVVWMFRRNDQNRKDQNGKLCFAVIVCKNKTVADSSKNPEE